MSFDLLFYSKTDIPTQADLAAWFSSRSNYEVANGQACYENGDTDVHFIFEFGGEPYLEEVQPPDAILLLNFIRPSPFVDEAAVEAGALSEHFNMEIVNPQEDLSPRPWDSVSFRATYMHHAMRACASLVTNEELSGQLHYRLPKSVLDTVWKWNFARTVRETSLEESGRDVFVPQVMIFEVGGLLYDGFVWTDAVPTLIPPTRYVFHLREKLGVRRFPGLKTRTSGELLPRAVLDDLIANSYRPSEDYPNAMLPTSDVPERVMELKIKKRVVGDGAIFSVSDMDSLNELPEEQRILLVAFSSVLDEELFPGDPTMQP